MSKVFLSGYFGFNNSGDEAILKSTLDGLRELAPGLAITVLSRNPKETAEIYGVETLPRMDFRQIRDSITPGDLFLSGGGGLLQDATGYKSIAYYLGLLWLAKKRRAKTMIFAQGVGPVNSLWGKMLTPMVLNGVDKITVRDQNSADLLKKLGVKKPVQVTADLVLALKPAGEEEINRIFDAEGVPQRTPKAAFSLRNWENCPVEEIIAAARRISEELNLFPVFIPFQADQDAELCEKVCRYTGVGVQLKGSYSPRQLLGLFSRMELTVGMRLHSLIYSSLGQVPALGLAYDPKVENFMDLVNLPWIPYRKITAPEIVQQARRLYRERDIIKADLANKVSGLKVKAAENFSAALQLLKEGA